MLMIIDTVDNIPCYTKRHIVAKKSHKSIYISFFCHTFIVVVCYLFWQRPDHLFYEMDFDEQLPMNVIMLNTNTFSQKSTTAVVEPQPVIQPEEQMAIPKFPAPPEALKPLIEQVKPTVVDKKPVKPIVKQAKQKIVKSTERKNKPSQIATQDKAALEPLSSAQDSPTEMANASRSTTENANVTPIKRITPIYPERARMLGKEGKIVVLFDIDNRGYVHNIRIVSAEPIGFFERAVKRAMRGWRYQAIASKDLSTIFYFKLNGDVKIQ